MKTKIKMLLGLIVFLVGIAGITLAASGEYEHHIELTPTNFTAIKGPVDGDSVHQALDNIAKSDSTKPFYLYLDTPGGSVIAGRDMVYYLQNTTRPILCIAHTAISMGFHILEDGCKYRFVTKDAIVMSHSIAGQMGGHVEELQAQLSLMIKLGSFFDNLAAKRLGLSLKEYLAKLNPEFWTVGSDEVLKNKEADAVAVVTCSKELEAVKTIEGHCPLL